MPKIEKKKRSALSKNKKKGVKQLFIDTLGGFSR